MKALDYADVDALYAEIERLEAEDQERKRTHFTGCPADLDGVFVWLDGTCIGAASSATAGQKLIREERERRR